jgi:uncharacterized DUF497 family protein
MEFEWDEDKRIANLNKHGIDFPRASTIWEGRPLDPYSHNWIGGEHRRVAIGAVAEQRGEKIIALIYTLREGRVRIISARPARRYEREDYFEATGRSDPP